MNLTPEEKFKFKAYVAHRMLRELEICIPEYIHTHHHLRDDIEDKGYEEVEEAFTRLANTVTFHWSPSDA